MQNLSLISWQILMMAKRYACVSVLLLVSSAKEYERERQIPRISIAVFLNYGGDECLEMQVILVGHDIGGACISHAMEVNPRKVSRAVFVAATMLRDGQSALDVFSKQVCRFGAILLRASSRFDFTVFEAFFLICSQD